jgi:hypothetical protein
MITKKKPAPLGPQAVPIAVKSSQTLVDPSVNAEIFGGQRRPIIEHMNRSPRQKHRAGISIPQLEIGVCGDHVSFSRKLASSVFQSALG